MSPSCFHDVVSLTNRNADNTCQLRDMKAPLRRYFFVPISETGAKVIINKRKTKFSSIFP